MLLRSRSLLLAMLLGLGLGAPGCVHVPVRTARPAPAPRPEPPKDYGRALPAGAHALRKITDPRERPDMSWLVCNADLEAAIGRSLSYLHKPSSKRFFPVSGIEHAQVLASLEALRGLVEQGLDGAALGRELERQFDVYTTVGYDDRGGVLFTGYYTPEFEASRERTGRFQHPLHSLPKNHVKDPITGETKGRKRADGSIDPDYPDRQELLASGDLDGLELVYLQDAFEAYIIAVQGSAVLKLPDGSRMEVGYAGTNGLDYASIGQALVKSGKLQKNQLNLRAMIEYFRAHPDDFGPLAAENKRYVFFEERRGGDGPLGCLNEPVTPEVTIATDKSIFPRGAPCFLDATLPLGQDGGQTAYRGLVLDQDAGGAIRAPGRCDVYMGTGEEAGQRAGHTMSEGRLYWLILKDGETTLPASYRD